MLETPHFSEILRLSRYRRPKPNAEPMPDKVTDSLTPDYASPEYAARVETDLATLQNKHRLAIHIWENYADESYARLYTFPEETYAVLNHDAEMLHEALIANKPVSLLSTSLLPTANSKASIIPYCTFASTLPIPGYLLNFDQHGSRRAYIIRASSRNLMSTDDYNNKKLRLGQYDDCQKLQHLYEHLGEESVLKSHAADDVSYNEAQLNILGRHIESSAEELTSKRRPPMLPLNEVIAAVPKDQRAAIVIPVLDDPAQKPRNSDEPAAHFLEMLSDERQALRELQGSLMGLQHLDRGIDLPVVFYHVSAPNRGKITFFAQGEEMLKAKATKSLMLLQSRGILSTDRMGGVNIPALDEAIKKWLTINVHQRVRSQTSDWSSHPDTLVQLEDLKINVANSASDISSMINSFKR